MDLDRRHCALDPDKMIPEIGLAWTIPISAGIGSGDKMENSTSSTLVLFEDDQPLGPPHAGHETIRQVGRGNYSHWENGLYFSTSDGSDPRTNGRRYRVFANDEIAATVINADVAHLLRNRREQWANISNPRLFRRAGEWQDAIDLILFVNRQWLYLGPGAKMLDFGCGAGSMVYQLRKLGFDCHGFDIHDYVVYRSEDDRRFFVFSQAINTNKSDTSVDKSIYRIPFPDNTFDFIFSMAAIEHVADHDLMTRECARVLKPDGIAVHRYPAKYTLVEPHIYVPLASFFHPDWWLRYWARLGVRNEFQEGLSWEQVVDINRYYIQIGLNYISRRKMRAITIRYFRNVTFYSPKKTGPRRSLRVRAKRLINALRDRQPYGALVHLARMETMLCDGKVMSTNR